jgi:hypothetical protein
MDRDRESIGWICGKMARSVSNTCVSMQQEERKEGNEKPVSEVGEVKPIFIIIR